MEQIKRLVFQVNGDANNNEPSAEGNLQTREVDLAPDKNQTQLPLETAKEVGVARIILGLIVTLIKRYYE